jgi:ATP-dependent helicase HrpB
MVQRAVEATSWARGLECCPLHGDLPLAAQRRAIAPAPGGGAKLVLATSIAESSLTIEGVRLVIDSGLSRHNRFDPSSAMDGLVTIPSSQASGKQRCGRAGRLGPGRCLRLWSAAEQHRRPAFDIPELMLVDPLPIALELAQWGADRGDDLPWLQPPPSAPMEEARRFLQSLGAIDGDGMITRHGRAMAQLGLHPRLAHMLLLARSRGWLDLGCALAVLLSERDPLMRQEVGCDLMHRLDWLRQVEPDPPSPRGEKSDAEPQRRRMQRLVDQLRRQVNQIGAEAPLGSAQEALPPETEDVITSRLISWAYPDRISLRRGKGHGRFLMRNGRGALVRPEDPLAQAEGLAIACVEGHGQDGRVWLAVPLDPAVLEEHVINDASYQSRVSWDGAGQRVRGERILQLGALVLEHSAWPDPPPESTLAAMLEGVREVGLHCLPWNHRTRQLQHRLTIAHRFLGEPWPDRSPDMLEKELESWLQPHLIGMRSRQDLRKVDLEMALWGHLPWECRNDLDRWLPDNLLVPSGRSLPIDYRSGTPVLAVKLQEMFGCATTPELLGGQLPITIQLLSPAGRPAAITRDLASFWKEGYGEVRRELRGRYPKHPWPEDPHQGVATALTKAGLKRREHLDQNGGVEGAIWMPSPCHLHDRGLRSACLGPLAVAGPTAQWS